MTGYQHEKHTAVIAVDIQGDFTRAENGSLATLDSGQNYLTLVRDFCSDVARQGGLVIATQDWHPGSHLSFASNHQNTKPFDQVTLPSGINQTLWPDHCIQDTPGARILLDKGSYHHVIQKGTKPGFDSYSGFFDDGNHPTGMIPLLKKLSIRKVYVFGLATDYCVKATAIDASKQGLEVVFIEDLSRPVSKESESEAIEEMKDLGISVERLT